jgi:hypothetical protein
VPAGRRGFKIREYQRRIDAVLEAHQRRQGSQAAPPPPISDQHVALRNRIVEACAGIEVDPVAVDWSGDLLCTPETAHFAVLALGLMIEEQEMLVENDVDYRLYQPE